MKINSKNMITTFCLTFAIFMTFCVFGFVIQPNTKTVFGEGNEVVAISATYDGVIIRGQKLNSENLSVEVTLEDETKERLNSLSGVNIYRGEQVIDETYSFNEAGTITLTIKLKTNESIMSTFDVVVVNKYIISFDSHGGSGTMADEEYVAVEPYMLPQCEFTAPQGKQFAGWAIGDVQNTNIKLYGDIVEISKNTTIYAIWKDIPQQTTYSIEFIANGGSGTMQTIENAMSEFVLPQCTFKAPAGKVFMAYQIEGMEGFFSVGNIINVTNNLKIYAIWEPDCIRREFVLKDPNKQIADAILEAQNNNRALIIEMEGYVVEFDKAAVQSMTNTTNVVLVFEVQEEGFSENISGTQKVITIYLDGTSFSQGVAQISIPLQEQIPRNKVAKVFSIKNDGEIENITVLEQNDECVIFETTHFSTFVLAYQAKSSQGLTAWAIVLIILASLLVVWISGFAIYWFGIQQKTWRDLKHIFKKQ